MRHDVARRFIADMFGELSDLRDDPGFLENVADFDRTYFDSAGSGGTLSFGASACMVISVIETRS
jgi:hypothetical protein